MKRIKKTKTHSLEIANKIDLDKAIGKRKKRKTGIA